MDLGADDYLTKPFDIQEVVSAVHARLIKRAQRSSDYQQQLHSPVSSTLIGSTIRGYEIWEKIGEGGWGSVYKAYQPAINRDVAIKVIQQDFAQNAEFIRRFHSEAEMVARLEHPHIVPLYDYWHDENGMFIVMRFVKGGSLRLALEREGAWPLKRAARLLEQVVSALMVAHIAGIIHRDLKPDNILLDEHGNAYLSDFGLAKNVTEGPLPGDANLLQLLENHHPFPQSAASTLRVTGPNELVGTPAYLSPEQIRSEPLSVQCDIYSLGITLYEILIGRNALEGDVPEVIMKQLHEDLPPIHHIRPDLPEAINTVIQRATAKDPKDRYPDILSLSADFRRALRQK
jgi:serine/threonine-protein kinase